MHNSASDSNEAEFVLNFSAITAYAVGLVLMMVNDSTTRVTLGLKPGLITSGMNRWVRHPNYLGETLIYAAFCINSRNLVMCSKYMYYQIL
jgi:steroid 5-alpha reductase family enzyme